MNFEEECRRIIGIKVTENGRPDLGIPSRTYYSADEAQVKQLTAAHNKAALETAESIIRRIQVDDGEKLHIVGSELFLHELKYAFKESEVGE